MSHSSCHPSKLTSFLSSSPLLLAFLLLLFALLVFFSLTSLPLLSSALRVYAFLSLVLCCPYLPYATSDPLILLYHRHSSTSTPSPLPSSSVSSFTHIPILHFLSSPVLTQILPCPSLSSSTTLLQLSAPLQKHRPCPSHCPDPPLLRSTPPHTLTPARLHYAQSTPNGRYISAAEANHMLLVLLHHYPGCCR